MKTRIKYIPPSDLSSPVGQHVQRKRELYGELSEINMPDAFLLLQLSKSVRKLRGERGDSEDPRALSFQKEEQ